MCAEKCVILLSPALPIGMAANTAAVLSVTLGRLRPDTVGTDVCDQEGGVHRGIITFPIPILAADEEQLRTLRRQAETAGLTAVDFTDLSQECRTYEEYIERMGHTPETALRYIGLALCGERKQVDHLTGSLPLLR